MQPDPPPTRADIIVNGLIVGVPLLMLFLWVLSGTPTRW